MRWGGPFLSILAAALCARLVAHLYIPLATVAWDEAEYLMNAYRIYDALRLRSFAAFWQATWNQFNRPPLQSWCLGIPLSPVGFSVEAARTVGLSWFILGNLLVFSVGKKLGGTIVGIVSSFFFLSSPLMLLHAAVALREMMGAALSLLAVLAYLRARETDGSFRYLLTSLALLALTMTKYNYGALIAAPIGVEAAIHFATAPRRRALLIPYVCLFLPFLLAFGSWLVLPGHQPATLWKVAHPARITAGLTDLWGYLLFFPRAVVLMYSASVVVGLFLLVSIVVAVRALGDFRVRLLWLCVILNFVLGLVYFWNMQERYIFTVVPLVFVLGAYVLTKGVATLSAWAGSGRRRTACAVAATMLAATLVIDLAKLPDYVYRVGAYTFKGPAFNQLDSRDLWFNYDVASWPKQLPGSTSERPRDVVAYVADAVDASRPVYVVGVANELPPDYFDLELALRREHGNVAHPSYSFYIATIDIFPSSRYYTRDYRMFNAKAQPKIMAIMQDTSLVKLREKAFRELGMYVTVYGRM